MFSLLAKGNTHRLIVSDTVDTLVRSLTQKVSIENATSVDDWRMSSTPEWQMPKDTGTIEVFTSDSDQPFKGHRWLRVLDQIVEDTPIGVLGDGG